MYVQCACMKDDSLLFILNNKMAHGAAAVQPLFQMQGHRRATYFYELSSARHRRFGSASTCNYYV